jgi:TetR/AcrR family fatty acid metabolism transcriptional regulator
LKTKKDVVSEFRRTEIIDAARTVFARRGFAHGIIDEIAEEAGMAKGTVYLYFRSKTEIYKAVLDHDMTVLKQSTLDRIDAAPTLRAKIGAFILSRIENAETRREFFLIMDSDEENVAPTRSQFHEFLREPVQRLAASFSEASARGEVRPVFAEMAFCEKTAWLIADMTRGVIQRRLMGLNSGSAAEETGFLLAFVWRALAL